MAYESYSEEKLRRAREAVEAQELTVRRAQAVLDKLKAEVVVLELEAEEKD